MKNREEVRTFTQRGVADLYDLYDFNKIIDRKGTSSWKYDFYEE